MDVLSSLPDLSLLLQTFKYALWALLLWICTLALSGCGVKAGGFVAGSTSYLKEANRGLQIELAAPKAPRRKNDRIN